MLFVLKALLGASVIGGGIIAPVALSQSSSYFSERKEGNLAQELGATLGSTVAKFGNSIFEVMAREAANQKVREALSEISKKKCELLQNPANSEYWFNALYACKNNEKGDADFYYLSSENILKAKNEGKFMKKVATVNYVVGNDTKLVLSFDDNSSHNWSVVAGSGWKYFKNVNLSEQCKVKTKDSGGSYLSCALRERVNEKDNHFTYNFSIF